VSARAIVDALERNGVGLVSYVPDSWLDDTLDELGRREAIHLVPATREEEAIAVGCGSAIAGVRSVGLMQNAGLLSAGNVIATLASSYAAPIVLMVVHRGGPDDPSRYQVRKGQATEPMLRALGVPYSTPGAVCEWDEAIGDALAYAEAWPGPYALLLGKDHLVSDGN
jgi:sulfopyruvate decarboxylase TPP-binding subunit